MDRDDLVGGGSMFNPGIQLVIRCKNGEYKQISTPFKAGFCNIGIYCRVIGLATARRNVRSIVGKQKHVMEVIYGIKV